MPSINMKFIFHVSGTQMESLHVNDSIDKKYIMLKYFMNYFNFYIDFLKTSDNMMSAKKSTAFLKAPHIQSRGLDIFMGTDQYGIRML